MPRGRAPAILVGLLKFSAVVLVAGLQAAALWIGLLGRAPEAPALPTDAGALPEPEYGVTWVPGVGPKTFGNCTRILSIDGGGVRGLIPALILAEIEKRTEHRIYEQFDLVVGSSTGSILALGLTRPSNADARKPAFAAQDIVRFYRDNSATIFPYSFAPLRYLRRIFRPKYGPESIESAYALFFEDVQLQEALTNVVVPGYDIEDNRRLWFKSYSSAHGNLLMRDLVRGATAAPTYLPPVRFAVQKHVAAKGYVALVDGALFANNPSQEALLFGQTIHGQDDKSVLLLSLGTGRSTQKHSFEQAWGWGVLGWMDPLLDIAFSDPAVDEIMSRALEGHGSYFRMQVDLGVSSIALDDASPDAMQKLEVSAQDFIKQQSEMIDGIVSELALPRSPKCGPSIGADYERPEGPRKSISPTISP